MPATPAPDATTPAATAQPPAEQPADKKICRNINTTSSRLRTQRICLTKNGWARYNRSQSATRYVAPSKQPEKQ